MNNFYIYGDVGSGDVTDMAVVAWLDSNRQETEVGFRINSYGGIAWQGMSIFNAMRRRSGVNVSIDGLAAPAASTIAMGASKGRLTMASNAMIMIHSASLSGSLNAAEMEKNSPVLRRLDENIAAAYAGRSGRPASFWLSEMASETFYTASEALALRLIDQITETSKVAAKLDPAELAARVIDPARILAAFQRRDRNNKQATLADYARRAASLDDSTTPRHDHSHLPAHVRIQLDAYQREPIPWRVGR